MIFVIGGNGLTGSAIVQYLKRNRIEYKVIQKDNAFEFVDQECDILIYANGNAFKYKAQEDPFFDFEASLKSVSFYIHKIKFKLFVHLSTVDVYGTLDDENLTREDSVIDTQKSSVYGFHKYMAENYVKRFAENYLIFRLPALVGIGLQKNPIYDFLHEEKKVFISPKSELNVIHTDFIAESIFKIINKNIKNEVFNLCSKNSIEIGDIKNISGVNSLYVDDCTKNIQIYKINTQKISKVLSLSSSENAIKNYISNLKIEVDG